MKQSETKCNSLALKMQFNLLSAALLAETHLLTKYQRCTTFSILPLDHNAKLNQSLSAASLPKTHLLTNIIDVWHVVS
jgi:hypothetical protein